MLQNVLKITLSDNNSIVEGKKCKNMNVRSVSEHIFLFVFIFFFLQKLNLFMFMIHIIAGWLGSRPKNVNKKS